MTLLGAACVLTCALAAVRPPARALALVVFLHWISTQTVWRVLGDTVYLYLPPRDLAFGALVAWMAWRRPSWSRVVTVLCLAGMAVAHVAYWTNRAQGVYLGPLYMDGLNVLFCTILFALGVSGGRAIVDSLRAWLDRPAASAETGGEKRPCRTQ